MTIYRHVQLKQHTLMLHKTGNQYRKKKKKHEIELHSHRHTLYSYKIVPFPLIDALHIEVNQSVHNKPVNRGINGSPCTGSVKLNTATTNTVLQTHDACICKLSKPVRNYQKVLHLQRYKTSLHDVEMTTEKNQ